MSDILTLTLLDGTRTNPIQKWRFETESLVKIGRAPDNHVVVIDPLVSRYHLDLQRSATTHNSRWIFNSRGTNGTFVNGVLASQGPLADGALLELAKGGPLLRVAIEQPPPPPPPVINTPNCNHEGNLPGSLFCIHCGWPIKIERTIRTYQILRTLGQGGMGTTSLAWDSNNSKANAPQTLGGKPMPILVVVKEMNADMAKIAKAQELFEREAKTLKSLNHQGVPKFYDFFVHGGKKYLVMEMIHGQDLEKQVYQSGPLRPEIAIKYMIQACEVLDYLHNQEPPIIHRDIKPANLMVRHRDRRIIVLDFGAVKEIGTPPGTRIGAEGYSAPEQDRGQPLTQSDLYAIGATLIFLLTGESPLNYIGKQDQEYGFDLDRIPTITPDLREVIKRVTRFTPRDRYQTATALATALAECLPKC
ncbi:MULTISPECIES: protein kinase domain-containing protein [Arthrospira]|jgi:serine/threonine-protein kinase|uniref:Serine/threonine protein kinase n=1 Tax=Limnospira platensis NIES-46 TaxID=1236695 RepID=A0A5M3T9Q9_LIMPL|nr:protein kinase [Arthrospira platensis]AMW30344.1 serine/threonine protein kinase [Arthrospira platensis YZ]MBD2709219.1 protein kinase [Arthrospira platensis FACHB-835]MDF2207722.1 protein kinase [Arthrospira platensis NCB002]MDT9181400.1 protein kinase [Limnospira sp. PMC 289.06]MDT9293460.1 protein kinase [Arthrospira platensis PCC 7345]MDT9309143.1 protein kinase [Limnospira sp. Paracas R14]QQW28297.1 protein kinase [Arthrospira sp. PCC 9108]BAI93018.1 serine/threonine protein kinase 